MNELHVKLMVISYKIGTCILNEMYLCTGYKLDFYRNFYKQSERDQIAYDGNFLQINYLKRSWQQ